MCGNKNRERRVRVKSSPTSPIMPESNAKNMMAEKRSNSLPVPPAYGRTESRQTFRSGPPAYNTIDRSGGPVDLPPVNTALVSRSTVAPGAEEAMPLIMEENAMKSVDVCPDGHSEKRMYGGVGVIAGIVFFPWGLFWTRCDSHLVCRNCGSRLVKVRNPDAPVNGKGRRRSVTYSVAEINEYGKHKSARRCGNRAVRAC